jgi:hypothetical protein
MRVEIDGLEAQKVILSKSPGKQENVLITVIKRKTYEGGEPDKVIASIAVDAKMLALGSDLMAGICKKAK